MDRIKSAYHAFEDRFESALIVAGLLVFGLIVGGLAAFVFVPVILGTAY